MSEELKFSGVIYSISSQNKKKALHRYETTPTEHKFHQSMMNSFQEFRFSSSEKQKLSREYRMTLQNYINLNVFELNKHAQSLILAINESSDKNITIEATDYGAFVCLTAMYSGKLSKDKKIEFKLLKSPVGLFPQNLMKKNPSRAHSSSYCLNSESWINNFETLYDNKNLSVRIKKAA